MRLQSRLRQRRESHYRDYRLREGRAATQTHRTNQILTPQRQLAIAAIALRPRVKRIVYFFQLRVIDVCVDLGRGDAGVT